MDSEKGRLVHSIEFLKDPYDGYEFLIALLSLNVCLEEMYQVINSHPKERKTLKVFNWLE